MISALISILVSGILPFADSAANRVWLKSAVESGEYRNIYDPKTFNENRLGAQGATQKGRILLSGRFEYGYDFGKGSSWRGWTDPYATPFAVCDSIPGNISLESYDMGATAGFQAGKWILGAGAAYRSSLMAKHKDLRNKNQRMDFSIAPRASYRGQRLSADILAGYSRNTEQVEYMQVDASSEKYLFQTYGLWFYTGSGFNSAEQKRLLSSHGGFAELSLAWAGDIFSLGNDFSCIYTLSRQSETGYNNLRHGDSERLLYSDILSISAGAHSMNLSFALEQMSGSRYLQRQELDPASGIRRWFSYGKPSQVYWRDVLKLGAFYAFRRPTWSVKAGADYTDASHSYKEFPGLFTQSLSWIEPRLSASAIVPLNGNYSLRLSPSLSYKHRLGGSEMKLSSFGHVHLDAAERQLQIPLKSEYAYWSADALGAAMKAEASRSLKGGRMLKAGLGLSWWKMTGDGAGRLPDKASRSAASISLGYEF